MSYPDESSRGAGPVVPAPGEAKKGSAAGLGAKLRSVLLVMGLALLGAVAAWFAGERSFGYFKATLAASENYRNPTALNQEMPGVNARNGALTYGELGGLLGLALGLAGGLAGRSVRRALIGAVVGLILGAAAGALPSFGVMPWAWRHRNDDPATLELTGPLLVHLGLWCGVGLAAGLAFGIASRGLKPARLVEAAIAGLVGAAVGTFVFEMVGAMAFPFDHTADPFPGTSLTRLLADVCIAGFVGIGASFAVPRPAAPTGLEE